MLGSSGLETTILEKDDNKYVIHQRGDKLTLELRQHYSKPLVDLELSPRP